MARIKIGSELSMSEIREKLNHRGNIHGTRITNNGKSVAQLVF